MAHLRRKLRGDKRGQFLILTTLGIVILMVTLSSLLSYTTVSPIQFSKTKFREITTALNLNFRRALAIALADASKELEHKASTERYVNFTKLEEYPEAEKKGWEFMTKWQNTTLMKYAGLGINLNISVPIFQCNWGSSQGYSRAEANMTLDILSYGFYGWKTRAIVEVNPTVLGLEETDGNTTSLYFTVKKEFGAPISDFTASMTKALFQRTSGTFRTTTVTEVTYFGGGIYRLKYYTNMLPILDALNLLKTYIMELGDASFIPPNTPGALCNKVDAVIHQYNDTNLMGAYDKLTQDVRPHLDTTTTQTWVYEYVDTRRELALIDDILSQLFPKVKIILNDPRGITVGAYTWLTQLGNDTVGPKTENLFVAPNPVIVGSDLATLTAEIGDSRSSILCAEYFIGVPGADGTGTPMAPVDGNFDSSREEVLAEIDVTNWEVGDYIIYVHGKDAAGNWGSLSSIVLRVIDTPSMHVQSIDMSWARWVGMRAKTRVTIVDSEGNPVEGAIVYGTWTYTKASSNSVFGVTNSRGQVTFRSKYVWGGGTFTFTVDDVVLSGWIYAYWDNVETSDSISG